MRINRIIKIIFSSTVTVYGESPFFTTPENGPFPIYTSLYGATKLVSDRLITAYCEEFVMKS